MPGRVVHLGDYGRGDAQAHVSASPGELYPAKQRPEQEIDATMALIMAVGRAMAENTGEGDPMDFLRNPIFG